MLVDNLSPLARLCSFLAYDERRLYPTSLSRGKFSGQRFRHCRMMSIYFCDTTRNLFPPILLLPEL